MRIGEGHKIGQHWQKIIANAAPVSFNLLSQWQEQTIDGYVRRWPRDCRAARRAGYDEFFDGCPFLFDLRHLPAAGGDPRLSACGTAAANTYAGHHRDRPCDSAVAAVTALSLSHPGFRLELQH